MDVPYIELLVIFNCLCGLFTIWNYRTIICDHLKAILFIAALDVGYYALILYCPMTFQEILLIPGYIIAITLIREYFKRKYEITYELFSFDHVMAICLVMILKMSYNQLGEIPTPNFEIVFPKLDLESFLYYNFNDSISFYPNGYFDLTILP